MQELYKKHRPSVFKTVEGQPAAVKALMQFVKDNRVPHALLFTGPSGCGKTTLARILQAKLDCSDNDFVEMNVADFKGIDMVRDMRRRMSLAPLGGSCRIYLLDECHELTKPAQEALLKMLEDTPSHVYFFLATTNPNKLLKTVRTRCTDVAVKSLTPVAVKKLLSRVCLKEKFQLPQEVEDKIIEVGEGSARKALVLLNQIIGLQEEDTMLQCIEDSDSTKVSIDLARALIKPKPNWAEVRPILKNLQDDPEGTRRVVLGYCNSIALGGSKLAASSVSVIYAFQDNFFDSGKAGLTAACWDVCHP